ncbi:MAG: hypothetical protein PHH43_00400, partial [Candidatus Cloacimonetes bacterium]|nr:hypothetical protein [Candidatus Cloacimonadota bacterium]
IYHLIPLFYRIDWKACSSLRFIVVFLQETPYHCPLIALIMGNEWAMIGQNELKLCLTHTAHSEK